MFGHRIRDNHPDRVPVIIARAGNSGTVPQIDKAKYLVPKTLVVAQFIGIIRSRLKLPPVRHGCLGLVYVLPSWLRQCLRLVYSHCLRG